ncbi:L,D-transpeptidase [Candidatus Nitrosoglobus terrae]|uniref:L,D-transpeptidase n=1 Tax=Candidatus Nitrosoglobus terrae TaxID=1630141 RepID=UPI001E2A80E3|nr:L,D-transpeptidase [Candidatus Nitrosoglobus terrae]
MDSPESIRLAREADGASLPRRVLPSPGNNPLRKFALRLGMPGYLIHGTNRPWGVGMRVSHGCVRFYPEDIEKSWNPSQYRLSAI